MPVRLLVVYKKSQLSLYEEHEPAALARLRVDEPDIYAKYVEAHEQNAQAIELVEEALATRTAVEATLAYRADVEPTAGYDLVVSVGGDGTLLDVSHSVLDVPLLGVNSSPGLSVGNFCVCGPDAFGRALDAWCAGTLPAVPLTRLQVRINDVLCPTPVLNELLYAHTVPAAMSRYVLTAEGQSEDHKSSGVWIASAAGSTAAIRSAGGTPMAPSDTRLQFKVREPYLPPGTVRGLLSGIVEPPITLLAKTRTSAIYLDGYREQLELRVGDVVVIDRHPSPLKLVGFRCPVP